MRNKSGRGREKFKVSIQAMLSRDLSLMEWKRGNTNMQLIKLFKYFVLSSDSWILAYKSRIVDSVTIGKLSFSKIKRCMVLLEQHNIQLFIYLPPRESHTMINYRQRCVYLLTSDKYTIDTSISIPAYLPSIPYHHLVCKPRTSARIAASSSKINIVD